MVNARLFVCNSNNDEDLEAGRIAVGVPIDYVWCFITKHADHSVGREDKQGPVSFKKSPQLVAGYHKL